MREEDIGQPAGSDGDGSNLDRRLFLGMLGALGAGTGLGGVAGADEHEGDDWEEAADERIAEHRTADLAVEVVDDDGDPLEGAEVEVAMTDHAYDFGTMIHAEFLTDQSEWGEEIYTPEDQEEYRETVEELFNMVVLENLHKWNFWEDNTEIADAAVDWAVEREMDVRGHVCLWGNVGAHAIPPDVVEAMGVEWEDGGATDPDEDLEYVIERSMDHIEEIITHYGDDVSEWEVKNEVIHETAMIEAVDGEDADPVEAGSLGDWYEHAQEVADEEGVDIAVNDFNTLAGPYEDTRDDYERQIDYLVNDRGIDLDGIGFQSHFADDETLTPEEIMEGLERYEGYGAGFRATEFDTFQGDWEDPETQGEYLRTFLKTFFSHPDTDAFLVWGHWDGVHWAPDYDGSEPDGVLFDQEWNPKPAHDHYTDLVFEEWWTEEEGRTEDGSYSAEAFLGEHELAISFEEGEFHTELSITDSDGESVEIIVADVDVRGAAGGRQQGTLPVHVSGGKAFDPRTLDPETIRFGTPEAVNDGEGATPRSEELSGGRNGCMIHFDAGESALEGGVAMLSGRTDDGRLVVGFDRY